MKYNLHIGNEEPRGLEEFPFISSHLLNIKDVDDPKKYKAHKNVSVDLKEEIRFKKESGRICIVGELPRDKQGLGRAPMIFAAVFIIFLLNVGQLIFLGRTQGQEALALASEAIISLKDAGDSFLSGEPGAENIYFTQADQLFAEAEREAGFLLNHSSPWLKEPSKVESLRNLLEAGQLMSEAGQYMGDARLALTQMPEEGSITEYIRLISESYLEPAAANFDQINLLLDQVDLTGTDYVQQFAEYREKLYALTDLFSLWLEVKEPLLTALGDKLPQHYLVLFENNNEMRLGGGFHGSYSIVEINDGRLTNLDFKDVYELDNNYHGHIEVPAPELQALTGEWRLRDSNTSPDFPTSAQNAIHLLDVEGGQGVDGVISINLSAAQAMLGTLGEVKIPSLEKPLTAEAFPAVLSTLVEAKTSGQRSPKAILGELLQSFLTQTQAPETKIKLGLTAMDEIRKKQINIYHRNESVQNLLSSMGLDAEIPILGQTEGDFALFTTTNIGGNKTDAYMQTNLQHDTQILTDGSLVNSLTITRTNTFNDAALAWLKKTTAGYGFTAWNPELERILGKDINRSGLRIYVPQNSELLEVTGQAHKDDLQYIFDPQMEMSYYYIDQQIAPGESQSFTVHYSLPWQLSGDFSQYNFQIFKQPGLKAVTFEKTVSAPNDILLSSEPLATDFAENLDYILSGPLQNDVSGTLLYR